jgi:uncharacterized membrane protein
VIRPWLAALLLWPVVAVGQGTPPPSDPSALTQAQLFREITTLKEYINQRLEAVIKTADDLQKYPTVIDQKLLQQKELETALAKIQEVKNDERFISVEKQINTQNQNNAALFAELKSTFAKQIEALQSNQASELKGLATTVSTIKDAQTASDSRSQGIGASWVVLIGAISVIVGLGGLFLGFQNRRRDVVVARTEP